jgi:molybdenum cofactor guanylyltransferase
MSVKPCVSAFIQAGGKSQRMGQNKALLNLAGQKLIEYPIKSFSSVTPYISIITNTPNLYKDLSLNCYPDIYLDCGPLGGIYSALHYSTTDYILTLACDMPFVSRELLIFLIEEGKNYQVCALYHKSCQQNILALLDQKKFAPKNLFSFVKTKVVPFKDFADLKGAERFFININTPTDFDLLNHYLS